MARKFNGTSDKASITRDLSGSSVISMAFWLWWDSFANNDKLAFEFTATTNSTNGSFIIDPNSNSASTVVGKWGFAMANGSGAGGFWGDGFTRPSAAAWHHYVLIMNRATPANVAYLDGALQTLTAGTHGAVTYGNFANSTLNVMCRNQASLFGAGRMAELGIWTSTTLTASEALALANGAAPPTVHPDNLGLYVPFFGSDSPEPDYSGGRHSATLGGTSLAAHPPVSPGLYVSQRGFQPMPV